MRTPRLQFWEDGFREKKQAKNRDQIELTFTLIPGQNFPPCFDNRFQNLKSIVLKGEGGVRAAAVTTEVNEQTSVHVECKEPLTKWAIRDVFHAHSSVRKHVCFPPPLFKRVRLLSFYFLPIANIPQERLKKTSCGLGSGRRDAYLLCGGHEFS